MDKIFTLIIIFLIIVISYFPVIEKHTKTAIAQTITIDNTVNEGSTAAITIKFYDENENLVIPEKVWYSILDYKDNVLQTERFCFDGTTNDGCPTDFFYSARGDNRTDSTMIIKSYAIGNREVRRNPNTNKVSIKFIYPENCTTGCKWGTGEATYEVNPVVNICVDSRSNTDCTNAGNPLECCTGPGVGSCSLYGNASSNATCVVTPLATQPPYGTPTATATQTSTPT